MIPVSQGVVMAVTKGTLASAAKGVRPAVEGRRAGLPHPRAPLSSWEGRESDLGI